jgi:alpha-tubulin suppressor-like RCC1 family protein
MRGRLLGFIVLVSSFAGCASGLTWMEDEAPDAGPVADAGSRRRDPARIDPLPEERDAAGHSADAGYDACAKGCWSPVVHIAAGSSFTCAVRRDGSAACWGLNAKGELGDGTTTSRTVPVEVSGLSSGTTAIAAGEYHACAIVRGGAKCWGSDENSQLGNTATNKIVPNDVTGLSSGVAALALGQHHSCALTTGGGVKCWGSDLGVGVLGTNRTSTVSATPLDVWNLGGASAIAATVWSTCALRAGALFCWGSNTSGELGIAGAGTSVAVATASSLSSGVSSIGPGGTIHRCAVQSGAAHCWGYNGMGQLGNGSTVGSTVPVGVQGLASGVIAVASGGHFACALTSAGGVKCWGDNGLGQLGNNSTNWSPIPVDVQGLSSGVAAIAAGGVHACALMTTGGVKCWGYNAAGQLGNNSRTNSSVPVDVVGL